MTGKPFQKTRIIISEKIITTRTGVDSFDEAAINFKNNTAQSMETSRLNINAAIKSLGSGVISTKKLTYENTDNKTRTNSGGEPGMVEVPGGIRYQPESKNEPGKILSLFPSLKSRESNSKTSNFGWLDDNSNSNAEVYVDSLKNKPQIRIRKFQVNPKTDEIIPESEIVMSRFRKENESDSTKDTKEVLEKRLPGASLGDRGTSLIGRAAGKFGVVRDALGKFRCPPGTPAANQFTDYMGTNCFGQSVGDLVDFAVDAFKLAGKLTEPNSKNTLSKFFKNLAYDKDNGRFGSYFAVTVWRDADGNKIRNLRKWNTTLREGDYQLFPNGMTQAQARLALQDARVTNLMDLMGIVRTPETTKNNAHLHELFDKLRETGTLNVSLGDSSGNGKPFTPEEVETMITARLRAIDGFDELPKAQKQKIIQNDIDRYYETEKALLESYLDEFIQNPEHIKTVPLIVYEAKIKNQDEASTRPIVWSTGNVGTQISIDIPHIMHTQETMLPQLNDNERLRVDVTGARTDAEAASVLSDFLITSAGYSKQHAAMVEERAFARHIMKHEIAHSVQFAAFHAEIRRQLNDKGFIEVIGKDGNISKVESMDDLTSDHLMSLMDNVGDSIDLESLNSALSRTEVVMFMAGQYPIKDYRQQGESAELVAIEACAELWALRDLGLISGDDVDAALEWMDVVVDGRYVDKRIRSDAETMKVIEDSYYLSPGITSAPWYVPEDPVETAVRKRRAELGFIKTRVSKMGQDEMVELLASAELEKDRLESLIESIKKSSGDAGDTERELLELLDEIKITRSVWKKKYGVGGSSDKKTLDSLIDSAREGRSMFTPDVMAGRLRSKEITSFKLDAASIDDPDEIIAVLADYEIRLREVPNSEKKSLKEEFKIYQDRYKAILKDNGDSRKWAEQKRELDENIDKLVRPTKTGPLKKPQTFSNNKAAEKVASESRNELMRGRTTRQREAVIMFSDSETSSIAKILDPEISSQVMNKIQLRNTRLKSRGKSIDPTSRSEGSVVDQIENILIPTMEVIDESRIGGNFEIEAVVEFQINEVTGDINIDEVSHDGFISGRVLSKKNPAVGKSSSYPVKNSKQKQRVIIQTTEEDRGIFPHWSMDVDKDDKRAQKLVLPPGKLRIVETRDDGTIVMQISEQKDTESILSTLPETLGAERGIKARTQRLVDEYIVERREKGIPRDSKRPLRSLETQDRGIIATREILKSGGRFGAGIPDDDVVDAPSAAEGVSVKTRGQQKVERIKSSKKLIEQLSDLLTGNENSDSSILSRDSLDPSVADIIVTKSPDEIIQLIENTAVEMHETMDKRTRVRMRESEVDDFTRTGRHGLSSGRGVLDPTTQSQTGNRLSRRSNVPSNERRGSQNRIERVKFDKDKERSGFSSGKREEIGTTRRVAGVAGSRATGRVLDAVLKRSGADEDTRERVKYGMNMAGALAAGGPAGFATALAVDVSRRAGREIAERGLEEAVQRGKITQQQMDVAMQAVNRVAPNGLPDSVVDKIADTWSVASDFIDERVATGENMQRLDEFGDVIRSAGSEFITNAGEVAGSAREKIGKKFKGTKKKTSVMRFADRNVDPSVIDIKTIESKNINGMKIIIGMIGDKKHEAYAKYTSPKSGVTYDIISDNSGNTYSYVEGSSGKPHERVSKLEIMVNLLGQGEHEVYEAATVNSHKRQGLASAMFEVSRTLLGGKFTPNALTAQGSKWWESISKFNPNHDELSRFSSGGDILSLSSGKQTAGVIDSPEQPSAQRVINRKGSAADNYRTEYLSQIGIPRDTPDSLRPVSGYVVNKSHIEEKKKRARQLGSGNEGADAIFEIGDKDIVGDGLTALGEIEVVLRPETANRVAYGRGDSIDSLHQPVMLDSTERDDIVNAIMAHGGIDKNNKDLDAILHLLAASKDKNFSHINGSRDKDGKMKPVGKIDPSDNRGHEIFEANILGGFSKDEVEGIHYPYSKITKLAEKEDISDLMQQDVIGPRLQKLGFTPEEIQYFYSISDGKPLNTASMQKLREYRAAKKIKKKYESAGIGYVKFAHPLGINIENPKTYDKTSGPRDNPEDILKRNIVKEMDEALELMLKDMRKKKTRDFVGRL